MKKLTQVQAILDSIEIWKKRAKGWVVHDSCPLCKYKNQEKRKL